MGINFRKRSLEKAKIFCMQKDKEEANTQQ